MLTKPMLMLVPTHVSQQHAKSHMTLRRWLLGIVALAVLTMSQMTVAETLIVNANGYTLNAAGKLVRFSALRIDDRGKVLQIGQDKPLRQSAKSATVIDAQGRTLLPGLIDAHGHVMKLGYQQQIVDLTDTRSMNEALERVRAWATANPSAQWIVGRGWNQVLWGLDRFPTAVELDAATGGRPAALERVDGHATWINSAAIAQAAISKNTADPAGGRIERNNSGEVTGILIDNADDLVRKLIPPPSLAEQESALNAALRNLASVGLTSVHDAGISPATWALFRARAESGNLTVRIYAMIGGQEAFSEMGRTGPQPSLFDDRLSLRSVKLYVDGALGSRGAALLAPYSDAPGERGLLLMDRPTLRTELRQMLNAGFQVNVHAIGDAGNREVLNAFADVLSPKTKILRNRIEHAQVVAPVDIPRFAKLGIIASFQPTHATSDMNMAEARLGAHRMAGAYAWRAFVRSGARMAAGSDFPVEPSNPFYGWHAAVTRQDRNDQPLGGWRPQDRLTRVEAFRLFTLDAAYAAHQERIIGSLQPGKWADFILTDRDPFTVPAKDIWRINVQETWLAGKRVFVASGSQNPR